MSLILICGLVIYANDKPNVHKILGSLAKWAGQEELAEVMPPISRNSFVLMFSGGGAVIRRIWKLYRWWLHSRELCQIGVSLLDHVRFEDEFLWAHLAQLQLA